MCKVYLVGSGPGDPELISLKGFRVLKKADIILYDRLVNPLILYAASLNSRFIYVGKTPDNHTMKQEDIEKEIIKYAKQKKTVVRLKGGDPSIYGRVGEEMKALEKAGISYEVIPGITTASAASLYCGFSITERYEREKTLICTPTGKIKEFSKEPLSIIAEGGAVTIYMGMKELVNICSIFLEQGASKDLPVIIIQWATTGRQKRVIGNISNIASKVEKEGITNPAMIIVGNFPTDKIERPSWFEEKPLFGKRVLFITDTFMSFEKMTEYTSLGCDFFPIFTGEAYDSRFDEIYKRILRYKDEYDTIYSTDSSRESFQKLYDKLNLEMDKKEFV